MQLFLVCHFTILKKLEHIHKPYDDPEAPDAKSMVRDPMPRKTKKNK